MSKKLLFSLFASGATLASFAQAPTLTSANVSPALNDSFVIVIAETQGVYPGSGGTGLTWDFSALADTNIADSVNIGNVVSAASATGYSALSAAATLLSSTTFSTSNYATTNSGASITTYYDVSVSKLSTTAIYYNSSSDALYTDAMDVLQFPFTYGTTFTDTYAGYILNTAISSSPISETGTVTVNGDAYGTLKLPPVPGIGTIRTYTGVLRVHSHQVFADSASVFGGPLYDTLDSYTWYQPGYHSPLLTIATLSNALFSEKSVSYARKQIANHENVPGVTLNESLIAYPNPAASNVHIQFNAAPGEAVRATLVDILGREVAQVSNASGSQDISYNVSSLPKGMYLLRLESATETVSRKIEIQ